MATAGVDTGVLLEDWASSSPCAHEDNVKLVVAAGEKKSSLSSPTPPPPVPTIREARIRRSGSCFGRHFFFDRRRRLTDLPRDVSFRSCSSTACTSSSSAGEDDDRDEFHGATMLLESSVDDSSLSESVTTSSELGEGESDAQPPRKPLLDKGNIGDFLDSASASASASASCPDSESLNPSCSSAADGEETDASSSSFVGRDRMIEEHVVACGAQQLSAHEQEGSEPESSSGVAESKSDFELNKTELDSEESTVPESEPKLVPETQGERGSPEKAPPPRKDRGEGLFTVPPRTPPTAKFEEMDDDEYDSSSSSSLTSTPPRISRKVARLSSSPSFVCVASPPLKEGGDAPDDTCHRGPSSIATAGAGRCPDDDGRGTASEPEEARMSSTVSSPCSSLEEDASSSRASSSPMRPHLPVPPVPTGGAAPGTFEYAMLTTAGRESEGENEDDCSSSSSSELEESFLSSFRGGMVADMIRAHETGRRLPVDAVVATATSAPPPTVGGPKDASEGEGSKARPPPSLSPPLTPSSPVGGSQEDGRGDDDDDDDDYTTGVNVCEVGGLYPIPESIPAEEEVRVEMEQLDAGLFTHATTFPPMLCRRASSTIPEKADVADETRDGIAQTSSSSRDVGGTQDHVCERSHDPQGHGAQDVESFPNGRTTRRLLSSHTSDGRRKVAEETTASPSVARHDPINSSKTEVEPSDGNDGTGSLSPRSSPKLNISMESLSRDVPRTWRDVHNEAVGIGETVSRSCRGQYQAPGGDGDADGMHDDVILDHSAPLIVGGYRASSPPPPVPNSNPLPPEDTTASMSTPTGDEGWTPGEGHQCRSRGSRCGHTSSTDRAKRNDKERCVSPRAFGPASRYCSSSVKGEKNQSSTFTEASVPIHTSCQSNEIPTSLSSLADLTASSVATPSTLSRHQANVTERSRACFSIESDTKPRRCFDNLTSDLMPVEESRSTSPTLHLSASSSFGGSTLHVRNEDRQQPTHDYAKDRCTESDISFGTPGDRSSRARRLVQQSPLTAANCFPDELDTNTVIAVAAKTAGKSPSSLGRVSRMKGPIHKMVTSAEAIATIEHIEAAPRNEFNLSHARKLSALKKFWTRKQQEITLGRSTHDDSLFDDSTRRRDRHRNAAYLPFVSANEILAHGGTRNGAKAQISSSEHPARFLSRCNQESNASLPASHRKQYFHPVDIVLIPFIVDGRGDGRPALISQVSKLESQATLSSDVLHLHPVYSFSEDADPGGGARLSNQHRSSKTSHRHESSSYSPDSAVGGYSMHGPTASESESSVKHRKAIMSHELTHGSIANRTTPSLPQTTCHTITNRPCVPFSCKRVPSTEFGDSRGNVKSQCDAQTDMCSPKLNTASRSPSIIEDDWSCSATVSSQATLTLFSSRCCR